MMAKGGLHLKFKSLTIVWLLMIAGIFLVPFSGCSVLEEAIESASNSVLDYDKGIKSLYNYENTTDLAMFMSLPETNLESLVSTTTGEGQEIVDDFGNSEKIILLPAKNTNHTGQVLYASIKLKSGLYNKDKLNCILKDIKAILSEYNDSCDQLIIVFRDGNNYLIWYTFIDNVNDRDTAIVCCADYINYIKEAHSGYLSIENKEYYYQCSFPLEIYDINVDEAFKSTQFSSADFQIQYKLSMSSDIIDCLDYYTESLQFDYKVYPDEEDDELTVIMYPREGSNKKDNMYGFWSELIEKISNEYEHYCLVRRISKDGEVVHEIRDGEELEYKLDEKKWNG